MYVNIIEKKLLHNIRCFTASAFIISSRPILLNISSILPFMDGLDRLRFQFFFSTCRPIIVVNVMVAAIQMFLK